MAKKILAIFFIYCCTCLSWMVLGSVMKVRTTTQDSKLQSMVGQLWGAPQVQKAPEVYFETKEEHEVQTIKDGKTTTEIQTRITNHSVPLNSSNLQVHLNLEHRQKGLLWYSTYRVQFAGQYAFNSPSSEAQEIFVRFELPSQAAVYDNFRFSFNEKENNDIQIQSGGVNQSIHLNPGQTASLKISYGSQGMDEWGYDFGSNVTQVNNFGLNLDTNYDEINFPDNSISPTSKAKTKNGWNLQWRYSHLVSGVKVRMAMPHKLNPGPWVSDVTYAAPVSLFLFFFLLLVLSTLKNISLHPMHYFFVGASFFSFHILLAYLVDHISIHTSFLIASIVSITLVISYLRIVAGKRFAFLEAGIAQFVYLVLFSYTFFFEEYTGLAVTVLGILTLFVVMQITARVNWQSVFSRNSEALETSDTLRCPYCRGGLGNSVIRRCGTCGTLHHQSCWSDHGRCAIFGCGVTAPPPIPVPAE
jgi:inner membrane protein involved in colicin E2 resistance